MAPLFTAVGRVALEPAMAPDPSFTFNDSGATREVTARINALRWRPT